MDPGDHRVVEPRRRPPRRPLADDLGDRVRVLHQPVVQLDEGQVDQPVVQVVAHGLLEQAAEQRGDRLLVEARHQGVADQPLDVVVADPVERDHSDVGGLVDGASRVAGYGEPLADPQRDRGRGDPLADDVLLEEVVPDELLQSSPQLVLAARDQSGVRDRQAERSLEQRGHREPVRDRTDHGGLGAGVDVAQEAVLLEGGQVDRSSDDQQRDGHGPHLPEAAPSCLVAVRVGRVHRDCRGHRGPIVPHAVDQEMRPVRVRILLMPRTVITFGTFDVFHVGHLRVIERAAALGDRLVVGVSADALNLSKKGREPVFSQAERLAIVAALKPVDEVFVEESLELKRSYIDQYAADVLVMGDDWAGRFDEFRDICEVVYLPRTPAISTTALIEKSQGADMHRRLLTSIVTLALTASVLALGSTSSVAAEPTGDDRATPPPRPRRRSRHRPAGARRPRPLPRPTLGRGPS